MKSTNKTKRASANSRKQGTEAEASLARWFGWQKASMKLVAILCDPTLPPQVRGILEEAVLEVSNRFGDGKWQLESTGLCESDSDMALLAAADFGAACARAAEQAETGGRV